MPLATVNHTLDAEAGAVPIAVLSPVVHDEPPPGAPGASPAACAVFTATTVGTAPPSIRAVIPVIHRRRVVNRRRVVQRRPVQRRPIVRRRPRMPGIRTRL